MDSTAPLVMANGMGNDTVTIITSFAFQRISLPTKAAPRKHIYKINEIQDDVVTFEMHMELAGFFPYSATAAFSFFSFFLPV